MYTHIVAWFTLFCYTCFMLNDSALLCIMLLCCL